MTELQDQLPPSWYDPNITGRVIPLYTSIWRATAIHGGLVLALKHPDIGPSVRGVLEAVVTNLELAFKEEGLEAPAGGWRAELQIPPEAGPRTMSEEELRELMDRDPVPMPLDGPDAGDPDTIITGAELDQLGEDLRVGWTRPEDLDGPEEGGRHDNA